MTRPGRSTLFVAAPLGFILLTATVAARLGPFEPLTRSLASETEIDAPASRVWQILTDFEAFPAWNPFIRRASGELRAGGRIEVTVQPAGRSEFTFRPKLITVERERELRWLGHVGIPGLFDGDHGFVIEPLGEDRVRFRHLEKMSGLLVPFLGGVIRDTERAFVEMDRSLKARAETDAP